MKRLMRFITAVQTSIKEIVGASGKSYCRPAGSPGGDLGRGGRGGGGSIRQAGGAFAERETAQEEGYFYRKTREQLDKLKAEQAKTAVKEKVKKRTK